MDFWLGLIAGLIIGWVIEWIIDWRFWRRDANQAANTETYLHRELSEARREIASLQSQLDLDSTRTTDLPAGTVDPLDAISGIDPAMASSLNAAGIRTYADLAAAAPEEIQAIASAEDWPNTDVDLWITAAQELALANPKVGSDAG